MKKLLLTLFGTSILSSTFAQLPVGTAPQNKHLVMEEYSGIYCGGCPLGHYYSHDIYVNNPGSVLINVQSGALANVQPGIPDLTTPIGNAISSLPNMGINGWPSIDFNRTIIPGNGNVMTIAGGSPTWSNHVSFITSQSAYCNVAVEGNVNASNRVLTYTAQVYYTANSPVSSNSLTVMLLEDKVLGPQHNYGNPLWNASNYNPDGSYNHNHLLRAGLTPGNFGITIPVTTAGTTFTTAGSYTIPLTYGAINKTNPCLLGNIKLAAFVSQSNTLTINGAEGPISISNFQNTLDGALSQIVTDDVTCSGNLQKSTFIFSNQGSSTINSAVINYSVNGGTTQTYNFSGSLAPFTQTVITLPACVFSPISSNILNISISALNGINDPITANNVISKVIPTTSNIANNVNMSMIFTSDQYGSVLTWRIIDETTSSVVASGGPYSNLAAPGTSVQPISNFNATPGNCYRVEVHNQWGVDFNGAYGAGNYVIKSGGATVYTMNGLMNDTMDVKQFKVSAASGIRDLSSSITNISVYPNPAKNNATIELTLAQNENISMNVTNIIGQTVYTQTLNELPAGNQSLYLNSENWPTGIYNINISTKNGAVSRRLEIIK